jgi:hypothetical protein
MLKGTHSRIEGGLLMKKQTYGVRLNEQIYG